MAIEEEIMSWSHLRNISVDRIKSDVDLLIGIYVPRQWILFLVRMGS